MSKNEANTITYTKKSTIEVNEVKESADKTTEVEAVKTRAKPTREEKLASRRNAIDNSGRLYLPDDQKEKGYVYRVCNVTPGNIDKYKLYGGEVVTHALNTGDGSLAHAEVNGSPREFEVGGLASGSMKAVWMRFTDEDYSIMKELEREQADHQEAMIKEARDPLTGNQMIPKANLIGNITKG